MCRSVGPLGIIRLFGSAFFSVHYLSVVWCSVAFLGDSVLLTTWWCATPFIVPRTYSVSSGRAPSCYFSGGGLGTTRCGVSFLLLHVVSVFYYGGAGGGAFLRFFLWLYQGGASCSFVKNGGVVCDRG